jgi:hypothetical protein
MPPLLTSAQIVTRDGLVTNQHPIPPITDPMGKYWNQPNRFEIEIDDKSALMSQKTFSQIPDYTHSQPTGVYPGKMWRCQYASDDRHCYACKADRDFVATRWVPNRLWIEMFCHKCKCHWCEKPAWFLRWFGADFIHPKDGPCVSNHSRAILIT